MAVPETLVMRGMKKVSTTTVRLSLRMEIKADKLVRESFNTITTKVAGKRCYNGNCNS